MAVTGVNTKPEIKVVDPDKIGFAGLTTEDFMKLLISQLQNQDPTSPMDSGEMLSQISQMRDLQANTELQSALKSLTLSQQLNNSTGFLGKTVTGTSGENTITGVVSSVQVRKGVAYLRVNGSDLEMKNVTDVQP